ncbi:MAG TPA: hydroxymethylbilane synthase [bacterium]
MVIGTRGSDLARFQANWVAGQIKEKLGITPEVRIISTQGDRVTDRPLRELEGRGYFTKEIEEALLSRAVDVAVHSFKDMPSKAPDGLAVAAVTEREDPADLLIMRRDAYDEHAGEIPLRTDAVVGTSAVRRAAQLRALRPDVSNKDLRGNVPTRVLKLENGQYDAIFLASAGVRRLGLDLTKFVVCRLDPGRFVPSPGQGALAIQMRVNDAHLPAVHKALNEKMTEIATTIERDVQRMFGGGCSLPLGVFARMEDGFWQASGFWEKENHEALAADVSGEYPAGLAEQLYNRLK